MEALAGIWGEACPHQDGSRQAPAAELEARGDTGRAPAAQVLCGRGGGGGLSPPGDIRVAAHCGGLCDARSGGEPHIWARSRLLEAAAPQPGDEAVIKAALVLLPPLARALPRHPLAALGSGPGAWGRWWRWGCSCACSCVGVSAGRAGAEPAAVAGPAQQPPCRRLRGAASGGRRRALCRARGGEARR